MLKLMSSLLFVRQTTFAFQKCWHTARLAFTFCFLTFFFNELAQAATYSLPANIGSSPFNNCSFSSGTTYNCTGSISLANNTTINITSSMALNLISGSLNAGNSLTINSNGNNFIISAPMGSMTIGNNFTGSVNLTAGGTINIGKNATITGNLTAGTLNLGSGTVITGTCTPSNAKCTPAPVLITEYRFDETSWNGTAGEVIDNIGSYSAKAASLNATKPTTANVTPAISGNPGTCSYGQFNRTNKDYVALPSSFSNLGASGTAFSITAWIRTTDNTKPGQRIFIDDEQNSSGYGFSIGDGAAGMLRFFSRGTPSALILDTAANVIANNTWYFVAAVADVPNKTKRIYVYNTAGTQLASVNTSWTESSFGADTGIASIGGETNAANENNNAFGFAGNIDEVRVYQNALTVTQLSVIRQSTHACASPLHHVRLNHAGTGVTCTGSSVTVNACSSIDTSGTCTAETSGLTGNVLAKSSGGAILATVPFTIAAGSSSTTVTVPVTAAQTVTFETSGLSVTPSNAWTCWNGSTASCSHVYNDSGFIFDVPHHVSEVLQTVNVSAVKKSDSSLACTPAFQSVSKNLTFKCSYTNPTTGTLPVRVNGSALNATNSTAAACDAGGRAVSLAFNASGVASTTFQYADVGNISLNATYTGSGADAGLSMTGGDTFIAAPKDFTFSNITAAPIKAGNNFSATVTARNNSNDATPNFGKETTAEGAILAFTKYQPTGVGAAIGSFTGTLGAFSGGAATGSNLNWSEVGTIDLSATLASGNYLSSGLTATGSTGSSGAVGRFIPDHFDTVVTQGCSTGSFTYSAQPFTLQVTARNLSGGKTLNYDGSSNTTPNFSKATTLSDANAVAGGSLAPNSILYTSFTAGIASATPAFTFASAQTSPATIKLRATDTDSVTSSTTEGTADIRSGRIRLQNTYGSELLALPVPLEAQYWNGSSYVRNQLDSCTTVPASSIIMANYKNNLSNALPDCETQIGYSSGGGTLVNGASNNLRLTKPGAGNNGSVDLTLNLSGISGKTCITSTESNATASSLPWFGTNPVSRATFGIYKTPIIYMRENF